MIEPELHAASLGLTDARLALELPARGVSVNARVGWHNDPSVGRTRGYVAVVRANGPYTDWIGETLRISHGNRSAVVYCPNTGPSEADLSLTLIAFMALGLPALAPLLCRVELLG